MLPSIIPMVEKFDLFEVYPNPPLIEVVCEIRFPGELAIECRKDEFYSKVRSSYPNILIPSPKPGQSSVVPYRFENAKRTAGIMLAINKFAFYEKKYQGHQEFLKEFMRLAKILSNTYSLSKLNRLGWRYVNTIPFSREDGIVPLNRFLTLEVKVPEGVSDKFENLSMVLLSKVPGGSITTRIESIIQANSGQEAILLDFDFAKTENLVFSKLQTYAKEAHEYTRKMFEQLITDNYRAYLKGESI